MDRGLFNVLGQRAIAAYLICMPVGAVLIDWIGGHDLSRCIQVGLAGLCAVAAFVAVAAKGRHGPYPPRASMPWLTMATMITCLAFASVLNAPLPAMALREMALFSGMAAVAIVTAGMYDPLDWPARVVSVASALYVALVLLLVVLGHLAGQTLNRAEIFVGYDNYRFFNHVQTAAIPLSVLALALARRQTWSHRVASFASAGGFALLFLTAGRGTLLGIGVACLAVWMAFGQSALSLLEKLGRTALLGFALFALLFWLVPMLLGLGTALSEAYYGARLGSVEARMFLWGIAKVFVEQHPWLGIGPMHFAHHHNPEAAHPHNVYLQMAAEWGMPLLLLVLVAAIAGLIRMARAVRQCRDARERDCGMGLLLALVAVAVDGLFSGNFVMPVAQVWIAFTVGWAVAWMRRQRVECGSVSTPRWPLFGALSALGLAVLALWLAWSIAPEVAVLDQLITRKMETTPNATMNPRFWSHGWF